MSGQAPVQDVFATATLAGLYFDQGAYREAAEIYKKLLLKNPSDIGIQIRLEHALSQVPGETSSRKQSTGINTDTISDARKWKIERLQAWLNHIQMEGRV